MVDMQDMAVAHFLGKMQQKLTVLLVMLHAILLKISLQRNSARKVEVQLAYAIGVAQPVSIRIDTFGTGKVSQEKLIQAVRENFDLRPAGIIEMLNLRRPILSSDSGIWTFWSYRYRLAMGTNR